MGLAALWVRLKCFWPPNRILMLSLYKTETVLFGIRILVQPHITKLNQRSPTTGLYTTLFFICIHALIYIHPKSTSNLSTNKMLLVSAVAMYLLCTTHVAIDFYRALMAFTGSPNAVAYYAQFWDPTNTVRQAIYVTNK